MVKRYINALFDSNFKDSVAKKEKSVLTWYIPSLGGGRSYQTTPIFRLKTLGVRRSIIQDPIKRGKEKVGGA